MFEGQTILSQEHLFPAVLSSALSYNWLSKSSENNEPCATSLDDARLRHRIKQYFELFINIVKIMSWFWT